jgi:hypothetical protein
MKKALIALILTGIIILSAVSAYTLLSQPNTPEINQQDLEPPTIDFASGDLMANAGDTITISAHLTDNVGVTDPKLNYRPASAISYSTKPLIDGAADLTLPESSNESWYYYLTADDAAHNGPIGDPSTDGSRYYTITVSVVQPPPDNESGDNTSDNGDNATLPHAFLEVATKTVCPECPKITAALEDLEHTSTTPFYYVTLPLENNETAGRIQDFNTWGYPTLYIDGGSTVLVGSTVEKTAIETALQQEMNRPKPNITVSVTAEHHDNTTMTVTIHATNLELQSYTGRLRVYLTEIVSSTWQANSPYRYSFLKFITNDDVNITAGGTLNQTTSVDISKLDSENLRVVAVLFNTSSGEGFSQPPDKNPFSVHQVDYVAASDVVSGGNLPPMVGIQTPKLKTLYILGRERHSSILGKTILLGATPITATASDDGNVSKVEFYIDSTLMATVNASPYVWTWHKLAIGKHTITVKAFDDVGKASQANLDVLVVMKWPGLLSRIRG